METDKKFIDGLFVKKPHANAPSFIKSKISIKREELITWLQEQEGEWINLDVKESQKGEYYAQVDEWKPNSTDAQNTQSNAPTAKNEAPVATSGGIDYPADEIDPNDIPF